MKPDKRMLDGPRAERSSNELRIHLDADLYRYLRFLEKDKYVRNKEEAVLSALRIFKKLNMHEWLPYVYKLGSERILLISQWMLYDILTSISETKLYDIARMTALKRRMFDTLDPDLDLTEPDNWDVILNELENLGWGKFTREGDEVMAELLGVPIMYLKGYLETMFQAEFGVHKTKRDEIYVLSRTRNRMDVWR